MQASQACGHDRANAVAHVLRPRIDEHLEELFAALRVAGQRAIGEAPPADAICATHAVEHPAPVQRPEPEMADEHGNVGSRGHRKMPRKGFHPTQIGLLPRHQRGSPPFEIAFPPPNHDRHVVDRVAERVSGVDPLRGVGERPCPLVTQEPVDGVERWPSCQDHRDQAVAPSPNSASRTSASTPSTKRRTGDRRTVSAMDGSSD